MKQYSKEELKYRQCKRVAVVLHGHWEEGTGAHSRLFETLVADCYVMDGESIKGNDRREHVVPCALIRDECFKMYDQGYSIEAVTREILRHLRIVKISSEEANHIDKKLGLKTTMPDDWVFGQGDPLDRLHKGGVVLCKTKGP